ncbi:MAG: class I SAM-dependent methyltransferase [Gammaproteobacteria bacterium]|nr:class I SAM-dependent methyltransferase [Gammaproteobacteria bacterium]
MQLISKSVEKICPESEVFETILSLNDKKILELGCGDAVNSRLIATTGEGRKITAAEVDTIQHEKNLLINDLPNVDFIVSGSEKIPFGDNSFDVIFMFKSFHHVPKELMAQALDEVKRVLKPAGFVYISEPIFSGEFNEILRLFHDEEEVRQAAFDAIKNAVDVNKFVLVNELFFNTKVYFENFKQYEEKVIGATHSEHRLSDVLYAQVKQKFEQTHERNKGEFIVPMRVDLLQKN